MADQGNGALRTRLAFGCGFNSYAFATSRPGSTLGANAAHIPDEPYFALGATPDGSLLGITEHAGNDRCPEIVRYASTLEPAWRASVTFPGCGEAPTGRDVAIVDVSTRMVVRASQRRSRLALVSARAQESQARCAGTPSATLTADPN